MAPDPHADEHAGPGDRGFWVVFLGAWLALAGLIGTTAATVEGEGAWNALRLVVGFFGPLFGLAVVVAALRRRILRPEWSLGRTTAVLLLIGVAYAVLGGWGSHAAMHALMDPSQAVEGGNYGPVVQMINALFLYLITAGFILWAESLRRFHESRRLLDREAMLRAQAEAKAIRAQFNPHFVFNTLHSLMLLVRSDPPAAERAIEDVGELIRYASNLQRREVDRVPLANELEVVRRYLALERLRLARRLHVVWDVEEGLDDHLVPAFSLQTVVENAIKHGLEPSVEGGTVTITVGTDGGDLVLTVHDDGVGVEAGGGAGAGAGVDLAAPGHGLDLLRQRLHALHGDAGRLEWNGSSEGFSVEIRVPARPGPDARGTPGDAAARRPPVLPVRRSGPATR